MKIKSKISFLTIAVVVFISLTLSFVVLKVLKVSLSGIHNSIVTNEIIEGILDKAEINITIIGMILVVVVFPLVLILSTKLTKNIVNINEGLQLLEKGMLPEKLPVTGKHEIGEIGRRINTITNHLKDTAQYSDKIGKGNFDENFQQLSEDDVLRNSLIR